MGWTPEVQFWQQQMIFVFSIASRPALGPTQPPIRWLPGSLSSEVKWQMREADHSPPFSAKVKNGGAIPPLPIWLHGIVLNYISSKSSALVLWSVKVLWQLDDLSLRRGKIFWWQPLWVTAGTGRVLLLERQFLSLVGTVYMRAHTPVLPFYIPFSLFVLFYSSLDNFQ
jgi:hypothetical protein